MERLMPHAGSDHKLALLHVQPAQRLNSIDVDKVMGTRQAERHGGTEALPPGKHAPVVRRVFSQHGKRLLNRLRRVIAERGGLHRYTRREKSRVLLITLYRAETLPRRCRLAELRLPLGC